MLITSTANDRIKRLNQLIKKTSLRKKEGLFVVEGWRSFSEIPEDCLAEVYVSESMKDKVKGLEKRVTLVSDRVMETVSDTKTSQGIIALVRMKKEIKPDLSKGGLFIICEHLQDPGNLGTILRMSEAAGVTAVILASETVELYNPKVVRATMGAIFRVNTYTTDDISGIIIDMKKNGISVYGAALDDSTDYALLDYKKPTAFVIGNEGNGMTEETKKLCSQLIHIPMEGNVESLNASVAASVLAFEAYRQRRVL